MSLRKNVMLVQLTKTFFKSKSLQVESSSTNKRLTEKAKDEDATDSLQ